MFSFFKKKSKAEVLEARRKLLLEEAFRLSRINREESDKKYAEADALAKEIEALEPKQGSW
jgi:hypothetical protein